MNLYKRSDSPDCPWTAKFSVRCRAYQWSTQTTDKKLALTRAKDYRQKIIAGEFNLADSMKQKGGAAKIEDIIAIYLTLPAPIEHTKRRNVAALKAVLKPSKLTVDDRVDRLGAGVVKTFQGKAAPKGCTNSAMVSANSNLRMARSVFSKDALLVYRETLTVPKEAIENFFAASFLDVGQAPKALPPEDAVKAAVLAMKDKPDFYRAFLLAAVAGCRASEIRHARRSWITGTTLTIGAFPNEYRPKSGKSRSVNLPQEAVDILLAGDDPVFLVGPRRNPIVDRELNALLRENGFAGIDKPLQSMRRRLGSLLYSNQSAAIAKETLGHSSTQVLERFYASSLNKQAPVAMPG